MPGVKKRTAIAPPQVATVPVYPAAIGWSASGDVLAIAGDDGTIAMLEGTTGVVTETRRAHDGPVQSIAWHPERAALLTTGQDGAVHLWERGDRVTWHAAGSTWADHACWSADGKRAAFAVGAVAHVVGQGAARTTTEPVGSTIAGLAFTPSGKSLGVACYGGVQLFDPAAGKRTKQLPWKGSMLSIAFSPDGSVVACGCQDNSVHFWRIASGKDAQMSGYPAKPRSVSFSHDGGWLATSGDAAISLWPFDKKGPEGRTPVQLVGHVDVVTELAYAPLVELLVSGAKDGSVAVWAPPKLTQPVAMARLSGKVTGVAWGTSAATGELRWSAADEHGRVLIGRI